MSNTNNHAYDKSKKYKKWWLVAYYDKINSKIKFTFLDNGFGIPRTIKKSYKERINKLLEEKIPNGRSKTQDNFLVSSALEGEFRTKTGFAHRGKGLPDIADKAKKNMIQGLTIISRKAYLNVSNNDSQELSNIFYGTLLSWEYS